MRTLDGREVELLVFSFKEGLLSKVAHDLMIRAQRLQLEITDDLQVSLTVQVKGLRVLDAMQGSRRAPNELSAKDKMKIEDTLYSKDVLHANAHPTITFASSSVTETSDGYDVQGDLTIRGRTARIAADVARVDDRLEAEVRLQQPDFGIAPYSALLGALKVKPEVRVRISVPAQVS